MNGLEAVKLMAQGRMVQLDNSPFIYRIKNDTMFSRIASNQWIVSDPFDFGATYEEYRPATGWEPVDEGEVYYLLTHNGVESQVEDPSGSGNKRYESANYYSTKEKAEQMEFKQELIRKLQRFSDENSGLEINWKNYNQQKYFIYHVPRTNELSHYWSCTDNLFGMVCFFSEEVVEEAIKLFRKDLLKYYNL